MRASCLLFLAATFVGLIPASVSIAGDSAVTFFVTSDSHYEAVDHVERNDECQATIERMNRLPGHSWPESLGGGKVATPRGVLVLGDLIDDGERRGETEIEWGHFASQFGLDGSDGLLKYPVFEGWGNHDGPPQELVTQRRSVRAEIKHRNTVRLEKKLIANVAENGLHYSWDWGDVHLVQLNLYPGDKPHPKTRYNPKWHDPQGALSFLKKDLKDHVSDSGRPVVVTSHYGFDSPDDWWHSEELAAAYDAMSLYNVVAYFHGHTGTKVYQWKPPGQPQSKPLRVVNTGQTAKGFFVVQIDADHMQVGYQLKSPKGQENEHGPWQWRYAESWPITRSEKTTNLLLETTNEPIVLGAIRVMRAVSPLLRDSGFDKVVDGRD